MTLCSPDLQTFTRRSCREPSLIEFFLKTTAFDEDGWTLVYYTRKRRLVLDFEYPKTVLVFTDRPDLNNSIVKIIAGIEFGTGLPEEDVAKADAVKEELRSLAAELILNIAHDTYSKYTILLKRCLSAYSSGDLRALISDNIDGQRAPLCESAEFTMIDILEELMPGAFTDDEVIELVHHFDLDGNGHVSLDEFRVACFKILSSMTNDSNDFQEDSRTEDSSELAAASVAQGNLERGISLRSSEKSGEHFAANGAQEDSIAPEVYKNWKLLYCGGSPAILDAFSAISLKTGMKFHTETFDW